jgi:hypothetical protein
MKIVGETETIAHSYSILHARAMPATELDCWVPSSHIHNSSFDIIHFPGHALSVHIDNCDWMK